MVDPRPGRPRRPGGGASLPAERLPRRTHILRVPGLGDLPRVLTSRLGPASQVPGQRIRGTERCVSQAHFPSHRAPQPCGDLLGGIPREPGRIGHRALQRQTVEVRVRQSVDQLDPYPDAAGPSLDAAIHNQVHLEFRNHAVQGHVATAIGLHTLSRNDLEGVDAAQIVDQLLRDTVRDLPEARSPWKRRRST